MYLLSINHLIKGFVNNGEANSLALLDNNKARD